MISIHKSKGLEFHSVIIPFYDWSLTHEQGLNPLLWCSTDEEHFCKMPLLSVKYGKEMKESIFRREYNTETTQMLIDNLNHAKT